MDSGGAASPLLAGMRQGPGMKIKKGSTLPQLKDWELSQAKTFTRWANSYLKRQQQVEIEDLSVDLDDGVLLIQLMECLRGSALGKYFKNPKMKPHFIDNLNLSLNEINAFLKAKGIRLFYSAENVMNHEIKHILGMMWILVSQFNLAAVTEEDMSAKEALLLWCHKKVKAYGLQARDFQNDWRDGKNLCALIHFHRPELIPNMEGVLGDATTPYENLELALDIAENELGIPRLLDPEDVLQFAEEKSMVTMLSFYWKAFAAMASGETAARRIARIIDMEQAKDQMVAEYKSKCLKLAESLVRQTYSFKERMSVGDLTLDEMQAKTQEFLVYKKEHKVKLAEEKGRLESMLSSIQAKLRSTGRAPYEPPSLYTTTSMNDLWSSLVAEEQSYDAHLRTVTEDTVRLQKVQQLTNRSAKHFVQVASRLHEQIRSKIEFFGTPTLFPDSIKPALAKATNIKEQLRKYRRGEKVTLQSQRATAESILNGLQNSLRFEGLKSYQTPPGLSLEELDMMWEMLEEMEAAYEQHLDTQVLPVLKKKVGIATRFENKTTLQTARVLDATHSYLSSEHEVDVHTDALSTSKALLDSELATLDEHVQNLTNRMLSLEEMCVEVHDQGLAAVSEQAEELLQQMDAAQEQLAGRRAVLSEKLEEHVRLDASRLSYAKEAAGLVTLVEETQRCLQSSVTASSLEDVGELLSDLDRQLDEFQTAAAEALQKLMALAEETDAENKENPYTRLTLEAINSKLDITLCMFNERQDALAEERAIQEEHNELRQEYANRASEFDCWCVGMRESIEASTQAGTVDEALERLKALKPELEDGEGKLLAAKAMDTALKDSNINLGSSTDRTIFLLFRDFEEVSALYVDRKRFLEAESETQKRIRGNHARYAKKAQQHLLELGEQVTRFATLNFGKCTLSEARQMQQYFDEYLKGAKVTLSNDRQTLDSIRAALLTQPRATRAPPLAGPDPNADTEDVSRQVDATWRGLASAESSFRSELAAALARLTRSAELRRRIEKKAASLRAGLARLGEYAGSVSAALDGSANCISAAEEACRARDGHAEHLTKLQGKLEKLYGLVGDYDDHRDTDEVRSVFEKLTENVAQSVESLERLKERLDQNLIAAKRLDDARLEFARTANELVLFLEELRDDLTQPIFAHSAAEVQWMQKSLAEKRDELSQREALLERLEALSKEGCVPEADGGARDSNPYTEHTLASLADAYRAATALASERGAGLRAEMEHQTQRCVLREDFVQKAAAFHDWCVAIKQRLVQGNSFQGRPEEQLKAVDALGEEILLEGQPLMDAAERAELELHAANILDKPTSMSELVAELELLHKMVGEKRATLEATITQQAAVGSVAPEVMREYREAFERFDKRQRGKLQMHELKAALTSLDTEVPEEKLSALAASDVDFSAFVNLMAAQMRDMDTYDQIVESFSQLAGGGNSVRLEDLKQPRYAEFMSEQRLQFIETRVPKSPCGEGRDFRAFSLMVFAGEVPDDAQAQSAEQADAADDALMERGLQAAVEASTWTHTQREEALREEAEQAARAHQQEQDRRARELERLESVRKEAEQRRLVESQQAEAREREAQDHARAMEQRQQRRKQLLASQTSPASWQGSAEGGGSKRRRAREEAESAEKNEPPCVGNGCSQGEQKRDEICNEPTAGAEPVRKTLDFDAPEYDAADFDAPGVQTHKQDDGLSPPTVPQSVSGEVHSVGELPLEEEDSPVLMRPASPDVKKQPEPNIPDTVIADTSTEETADSWPGFDQVQSEDASNFPDTISAPNHPFKQESAEENHMHISESCEDEVAETRDDSELDRDAELARQQSAHAAKQLAVQQQRDIEEQEWIAYSAQRARAKEQQKLEELQRVRKAGKKGWLMKQGGSKHSSAYTDGSRMSLFSRKNWKKRLFQLDDVGYLSYYKHPKDIAMATPAGKVDLSRVLSVQEMPGDTKHGKCFSLQISEKTPFVMCADTEDTRDEWMLLVNLWIDHFSRSEEPPTPHAISTASSPMFFVGLERSPETMDNRRRGTERTGRPSAATDGLLSV